MLANAGQIVEQHSAHGRYLEVGDGLYQRLDRLHRPMSQRMALRAFRLAPSERELDKLTASPPPQADKAAVRHE
jgi:hypothetical protein